MRPVMIALFLLDAVWSAAEDAARSRFAVAVLGGLVGTLVTMIVGVFGDIRHHDQQIAELDADLGQWVADEMVRLERAAAGLRQQGQLTSADYLRRLAHLKEQALHAYRDQQRAADHRRAMIGAEEGWRHNVVRSIRHKARATLQTPAMAAPLLDLWRGEVRRNDETAPVSDPTRRSLAWAVQKYVVDEDHSDGWPAP